MVVLAVYQKEESINGVYVKYMSRGEGLSTGTWQQGTSCLVRNSVARLVQMCRYII